MPSLRFVLGLDVIECARGLFDVGVVEFRYGQIVCGMDWRAKYAKKKRALNQAYIYLCTVRE